MSARLHQLEIVETAGDYDVIHKKMKANLSEVVLLIFDKLLIKSCSGGS